VAGAMIYIRKIIRRKPIIDPTIYLGHLGLLFLEKNGI
jgi:hypothetical protein